MSMLKQIEQKECEIKDTKPFLGFENEEGQISRLGLRLIDEYRYEEMVKYKMQPISFSQRLSSTSTLRVLLNAELIPETDTLTLNHAMVAAFNGVTEEWELHADNEPEIPVTEGNAKFKELMEEVTQMWVYE